MPEMVLMESLVPEIKPEAKREYGRASVPGVEYDLDYNYPYRNQTLHEAKRFKGGFDRFHEEYADAKPELQKKLREEYPGLFSLTLFRDRVVVELACGNGHGLVTYKQATAAGAKGYIGEDKNINAIKQFEGRILNVKDREGKLEELNKEYGTSQKMAIPISLATEDMLSLLKRLPDNSVGIMMSGVDNNIMSRSEDAPGYWEEVESEIKRVLHPKSGLVTISTEIGIGRNRRIVKTDFMGCPIEIYLKEPIEENK